MKVMIVGGTGNISTSIVEALLVQGHEVVCFNRGQTSAEPLSAQVRQLHGDRRNRASFEEQMRSEKPDAAIDMVGFTAEDAESDLRAFPAVERLVFCSTTCVYGVEATRLPLAEDAPPHPFTGYGQGKLAAERVLRAAWFQAGYPVTILRPSSTYGNQVGLIGSIGQNSVWLDRVKKGKPVLVCGSGNNPHQFLHVRDAAAAFVGALQAPACLGQVYNLVGPGFTEWNTWHRTGIELLGRQVPILGVPLDLLQALGGQRFGYACEIFGYNIYYDGSRLARDLPGWRPLVPLAEGMREVIAWSERHGTIPDSDAYPLEDRLAQAMLALRNIKEQEN
ncbi:MAG: NAD-dependent epimerase/dehydratase family protein [Gemmiger sp.]|nr:NAD-dependent epimerase/dehydratase family protein [Gemmiger sp.]